VNTVCSPAPGHAFPKGTTTVTCTATDGMSNTTSCSFTVTVNDSEAPVVQGCANLSANTPANGCSIAVQYPVISATDNCQGVGTPVCTPPTGSTFQKGTTTVNCLVSDASSNQGSCSFTVTVTDTTAPTLTCPPNKVQSTDANQCQAVVTYANATATDNCPNVGAVTCSPASGTPFPKGTTTVTCTASDASGNSGSCSFTVTVNDTQAPQISCPANITRGTDANQCSAVVTYGLPTVSDNCSNVGVPSCSPASGSTFQKGTTTVNCFVNDASLNQSTCSFTVTVNDTQAPQISCPANISKNTDANQCSAIVTYATATATDNCAGVGAVSCSPASGSSFPKGVTTVTCSVTDASSNQSSCTFTVTVNDRQNPTMTCPVNIIKAADPNQCSAVVTYGTPTAADNCPNVGAVTCSPASNTAFPKGTTTVTCTVNDASGNSGSCSFTVTINDTQAPTLSCPANITRSTDANQCSAVVTFSATASDNCPGATISCSPASGASFPKGTTTVTCTASDSSGNSSTSCSFTVTVNDTQAPSIACPVNIVKATDANQCSAVVTYALPLVSDNCPGVGTPVCTPASGTAFPKGTTTVNCTVRDASNQQSACSFTVTVNDAQAPQISCPANIIANTVNPGDATVVVNFAMPQTSDNCPGGGVICTPASGSAFPRGTTTVTCTATDAANNRTSCSFTVRVFDYVIVDDSNGKILRFDSLSGDYDFFDCRKNTSLSGRGVTTLTNCKVELRHTGSDPKRPDRNLSATANPCSRTGTASLSYAAETHLLNDANLSNNLVRCP
jgi:hypothetical protein